MRLKILLIVLIFNTTEESDSNRGLDRPRFLGARKMEGGLKVNSLGREETKKAKRRRLERLETRIRGPTCL